MAKSVTTSTKDLRTAESQVVVRGRLGTTELPWMVVDIDVAIGLPDLSSTNSEGDEFGGAFVLVRVFTEPVAGLWVSMSHPGLSKEEFGRVIDREAGLQIRQRLYAAGWVDTGSGLPLDGIKIAKHPEWLLGRETIEIDAPNLTIAVCTRDRLDDVKYCLASLQEQTYPRLTILVVDNAPKSGDLRDYIEQNQFKVPVRYVVERKPGLSHARNKAVEQCATELIAFIDDDEVACTYWASEVVRGFVEDPKVDCVTGAVVPSELSTQAQQLFERYGGHTKGRGFRAITFDGRKMGPLAPLFPLPPFGVGANMSFRASIIRELGGFNTALGAGTASLAGEDTEVLSAILLEGRRIAYRPAAVVRHCHRTTYEKLLNQFYGLGVGLTAFYTAMLMRHPLYVFRLLALAPRAFREVLGNKGERAQGLGDMFLPADLLNAHRRGMIKGPVAYCLTRMH